MQFLGSFSAENQTVRFVLSFCSLQRKKYSVFFIAFNNEFKYSFVSVKNEVLCSVGVRENGENSVKNFQSRNFQRNIIFI